MQEQTLDGHAGRPVAIDLCLPCQSFWFDAHESVRLTQASALVAQLQKADARGRQPIDPALPLSLLRARRQAEAAFPNQRRVDWSPGDLVDAGIQAVAGWLKRNA